MLKFIDETQIVRVALLVFGAALIAIGVAPTGWMLFVIGPFTSFGFSLINVGVQSLISLESKREEQGVVLGISQSFGSMARVIGPLVGGIIGTFNIGIPYFVAGVMTLIILVWGQRYLRNMRANKLG
jgi:MFS family permease